MPEILFHTPAIFSGKTGTVDSENCIIHGVSLITGNVPAEGHDMDVDAETVKQLHALAKAKGKVPVNLDHGSGIEKTVGWVQDFRIDGDKLRGDFHLLNEHSETPLMLERAAKMPDCFGLSAAFKGKGVMQSNKRSAARATKLLSFDCVTRPAANASLFSAKDDDEVDTAKNGMANKSNQPAAEPTLADVMAAIQSLGENHAALAAKVEALGGSAQPEGGDEDTYNTLKQLYHATDEELAANNLTRAEVNAAVAEWDASVSGEAADPAEGGEGEGGEGGEGEGGEAAAAPTAGISTSAPGVAVALNAFHKELVQLKAGIAKEKRQKALEEENIQFAAVDQKIDVLANQRDAAVELAEGLVAENEALRLAVRTGVRPVKGSTEALRLFSANEDGELHEFQLSVKAKLADKSAKTEGEAILLCSKENPALHKDWLQTEAARRRPVQ